MRPPIQDTFKFVQYNKIQFLDLPTVKNCIVFQRIYLVLVNPSTMPTNVLHVGDKQPVFRGTHRLTDSQNSAVYIFIDLVADDHLHANTFWAENILF